MKCKIPEISWHNRDPVLSVDIQPKSEKSTTYRVASGGTDTHVLIWNLNFTDGGSEINIDVAADLTRHQRAVNAVKWSPSGELLASGDDESFILIWKQKSESEPINILDTYSEQDKEIWITLKILRGHMEDVYDLSWSPNSNFLVSGSVDNTAIIWDVHKGKSVSILNDHKGFVQGVTWDPKNQYIATLCTDRYLRIFDIQTKKVLHRISKSSLPVSEGSELFDKRMRLYHDDTLQTFFRRLCFTPDGKLLITPAGVTDYDGVVHPLNTTYIFSRYSLKQPAIVLPCPDQYTVAVKCCPILFNLRPFNQESNPPVIPLPYRMIFAIATKSSVYLYDTQQRVPFGLISNIHYTRLTDITWSNDGRIIIVSSTDGFCSIITFDAGELGDEYSDASIILANSTEENASKEKKLKSKQKDSEQLIEKVIPQHSDETAVKTKEAKQLNDQIVSNEENKKKENEIDMQTSSSVYGQKVNKIFSLGSEKSRSEKDDTMKDISGNNTGCKSTIQTTGLSEVITEDSDKGSVLNENASLDKKCMNNDVQNAKVAIDQFVNPVNPVAKNLANISAPSKFLLSDTLGAEIIIDKKIISSDEKFESPEKKSRPATPIMVRRHPRTPTSNNKLSNDMTPRSIIATTPDQCKKIPASPAEDGKTKSTTSSARQAKPIATRRKPRALITVPVDKTTLVEEAMDAWPLDNSPRSPFKPKPDDDVAKTLTDKNEPMEVESDKHVISSDTLTDGTEDMRLVYEDSTDVQSTTGILSDISKQIVISNEEK